MEILSPDIDLAAFFRKVSEAQQRVLLLDYDGTLAPFTVHRDEAYPYRGVRDLLSSILALPGTRIVLVTGRTVEAAIPLLGLDPPPEIWGSHGWEHLSQEGVYSVSPLEPMSEEKLRQAGEFLATLPHPNLRENKRVSVAAHWRGLPPAEVEQLRRQISAVWDPLAEDSPMEVHAFDGGLELRPKAHNKGTAVADLLTSVPQSAAVAYLGDDITDEDAFRALAGRGLRVLVRKEPRTTAADLWARPPEDLLAFLASWRDACSEPGDRSLPAACANEALQDRIDKAV